MPSSPPPLRAVVCTDDEVLGRAVALLLHASGLEVVGIADTPDRVVEAARGRRLDVIVGDIAALGVRGLAGLTMLRECAPGCAVALVSPFPSLAEAALEAGASAVVNRDDLRPLLDVLSALRARAHAGFACTCCGPAETTGTVDSATSSVTKPRAPKGLLWGEAGESSPAAGTGETTATSGDDELDS